MSAEPASGPPITESTAAHEAAPQQKRVPDVEYDDFGLPIRKPRPKTPLSESSESGDEEFKDAVRTKPGSQEAVTQSDAPIANGNDITAIVSQHEKASGVAEPMVNGHAAEDEEKVTADIPDKDTETPDPGGKISETGDRTGTVNTRNSITSGTADGHQPVAFSEYSHQQLAPQAAKEDKKDEEEVAWQAMPAYARYDMYDDDNKLVARENLEELEDMSGYGNLGGAAKGYTRVTMDDDVESQTSMDENTAYLFKENGTALIDDDDEAARDPLAQMQTTKNLLTEGQRIAYVGLVRLAMAEMSKHLSKLERTKGTKKIVELSQETTRMWSQKMMVRLYAHMEIDAPEQIMIEQLSEHGVIPADLTPALMQNARVKNPAAEEVDSAKASMSSPRPDSKSAMSRSSTSLDLDNIAESPPPPPYEEHEGDDLPAVRTPSQLPQTQSLDIDLRWTILCDLFLVLIADSVYDARSRQLLEHVGKYLSVDWLEICRFEKRVTDALEMQEEAAKENWNEDEHMESRRKRARNRRLAFMGLATVGGSLVIGLSAGLLAPVIGAGLAAGFTTIGVAGTGGFLAGAGGAAVITTTGVLSGGTIAVRAANRRTGSVKTFEYRPLHNNKRVNLIVTIAGWMNGKVDDVRLPYSTVDPIMGDMYSVLWEPEMLRSMGDTINILATEALTQGLQQVLGSTILIALMAALQLPVALTKLAYLIDNPWTVSQARADMAGLILADSLIDRNLGTRPITLVGFSLGARVIFSCLRELANRGAFGLIQNVYMFGTPVVAKKDEYTRARSMVPGRFVNGYATNDWILGYLFRATSGGIMRVSGLAPVEVPGIENINVTELVPGHMAYRTAMPKLLMEVGWSVESEEFSEIEDPDPENHEKRQRELINEIEEARKELEKKQQEKNKKGGFFSWRKKKAAKKDWEVYDENSQKHTEKEQEDPAVLAESTVMFDVDALRAEVAALSAEGIEIKEIKSTLPPMKIDMAAASPSPHSSLRETKSYNDSLAISPNNFGNSSSNLSTPAISGHSTPNKESRKQSFEEYDEHQDDTGMTMTFDSSFKEPPAPAPSITPARSPALSSGTPDMPTWDMPSERPALKSATSGPNLNLAPGYNAWAEDDDDFGKEKEMKMTFE
ncbi:DUF726-domain-containing protein [Lophiostoma macrostomum CBS 122681]|uniref:DUF726-domain-containing protein n=1 Tax=Lophiostoma macrostomum CBS 122681 TaxID=1314788 RepID=A0A6A6TVB9_9PLEO|nr:DUF726-domain-containing protein [Lophiostoma macrostomum CBS 122681]